DFLQREPTFLPDLLARLENVTRVRFDGWFRKNEDERVFLGFTVSRLRDKAENFLGFIFSFQDLTDRKALEEEVQLRQRMAAIGGIAAGMAHEIRNPLASITGSVQLLKRELPMEPTHQELMQIILTESKRLDGILRDFLSYARPGRVDPESVDVVVLVREAVQLLKNSEECQPGHRIRTRFQAESIHAVLDTNRIRQVIWNLARNGLKSMPAGGTLTIGVEERPDGGVAIFFQDEGTGMTEKEIENCFQPFRGGFSQGTGLGLSIVYRVVEEHEGKIQIESEKNKGTRVEVFLPAERKLFVTVGA
ncbi:MAG: ATP-binding protein, partial [Acidobacteriota bacterium]